MTDSSDLDLSSAPAVLFLFGLSGSGKSYVGDLIGQNSDRFVYHADEDLTPAMQKALAQQRPFTEAMRDEYFPLIAAKIDALRQQHGSLVVTQGAYKQRHRDYLLKQIADMEMIWVDAADTVIAQRFGGRDNGISASSASALRNDFEQPCDDTKIITNDGDSESVIQQLNRYFSINKKI